MKVFIDEITVDGKSREIYLESDDLQYVLKEYYTVEKGENAGKETSQTIGYYPNITSALKKVLSIKVKESTAQTLAELVADIQRIEDRMKTILTVNIGGAKVSA